MKTALVAAMAVVSGLAGSAGETERPTHIQRPAAGTPRVHVSTVGQTCFDVFRREVEGTRPKGYRPRRILTPHNTPTRLDAHGGMSLGQLHAAAAEESRRRAGKETARSSMPGEWDPPAARFVRERPQEAREEHWDADMLARSHGATPESKDQNPESRMKTVRLITVDPGHYHASLVQKRMYDQVDPVVHVYAPAGPDLDAHLKRIELFNTRADDPTRWIEKVYTGPDYFERMLEEKPGNLVILAGNNTRKTQYILGCVKAGLNVLADKPMAIDPAQYELLLEAFRIAGEKRVLLYDIMTERYEIATILQRELSMAPEVFGTLEKGTVEQPAVTKESVHHFSKLVAGKPLIRPAWFFDVKQEGEGIVDVATHLVDLVQWECFPEQVLRPDDVRILSARRWSTPVTLAQFQKTTHCDRFPDFLTKDVKDGVLHVYGNGEINYTLRGHVAKVSVVWNYEAPPGAEDTHYSIMRGSRADLIIRQGREQRYQPTLYVDNKSGDDEAFDRRLRAAIDRINARYAGVTVKRAEGAVSPRERQVRPPAEAAGAGPIRPATGWEIVIPDALKASHEQHFVQVTDKFLGFLAAGAMPRWEVPNMIVKYHTIMEAYKASR